MARDTQKVRVYRAGDAVVRSEGTFWFSSLSAIQTYVDKVTAEEDWQGPRKIHVSLTRRDSCVSNCISKGRGGIRIAPGVGANDYTVLHELAHCVANGQESHGEEFCKAWLDLVKKHKGSYAKILLRREFDKHGVRYGNDAED